MTLELIILALAVPVGFLISWLAKDELEIGRRYFRTLIILSFLVGSWMFLIDFLAGMWTSGFALIVSLISLIKGFDKSWMR